jgi:hypothetical protein
LLASLREQEPSEGLSIGVTRSDLHLLVTLADLLHIGCQGSSREDTEDAGI